jgi:hypothetical protein
MSGFWLTVRRSAAKTFDWLVWGWEIIEEAVRLG